MQKKSSGGDPGLMKRYVRSKSFVMKLLFNIFSLLVQLRLSRIDMINIIINFIIFDIIIIINITIIMTILVALFSM